jgi:hypothetical protein
MDPMALSHEHDFALTTGYKRSAYLAFVLIVLVIVTFFLVCAAAGITLNWLAVGSGALGWVIAFVLRGPVAFVAKRLNLAPAKAQLVIGLSSGPCEEIVRLLVLLLIGRAFPLAISIGLGWAAIEILYTIINGIVLMNLLGRDDEKSRQAKEMLKQLGQNQLSHSSPLLGVLERISASCVHIGLTLILAWQPWLTPVTMLVHSGINYSALTLARKSVLLLELILLPIGALILLIGLALSVHI